MKEKISVSLEQWIKFCLRHGIEFRYDVMSDSFSVYDCWPVNDQPTVNGWAVIKTSDELLTAAGY